MPRPTSQTPTAVRAGQTVVPIISGEAGKVAGSGEIQSSHGGLFAFDVYCNAGTLNAAVPVLTRTANNR